MMTMFGKAATALISWLLACQIALAEEPYRLGPEDRIGIRVVIWDEAARAYERWDVLDGEYTVRADGTLSLPLAGKVPAAGQTLDDLTGTVAAALRERGGLRRAPDLALSVVTYRPIYVTGDVAQPGAYEGRPGLTALQAATLAGGTVRPGADAARDPNAALRDASRLMRTLGELARARIRLDRLKSESSDAAAIRFDASVTHPDGQDRLDEIREDERKVFDARRRSHRLNVETLEDLGRLLEAEIDNLERKLAGQSEQIGLAETMLANVSGLAEQGLARGTRLAEAQSRLLDLRGEETDLLNNIYRARQRITENARDLVELRTRRLTEIAQETQRVTEVIEGLEIERALYERLVLADSVSSATVPELTVETTYSVQPSGGTAGERRDVGPAAPIGPGDVLIVRTLLLPSGPWLAETQ
jgi:protein involved in polysaccharide export with SLBB domain